MRIAVFGIPHESKCTLEIMEVFTELQFEKRIPQAATLSIIGETKDLDFARKMNTIKKKNANIFIKGFLSNEMYLKELSNVDLAVQLRKTSNGETSAALLDTMSHGIPTITNYFASNIEIPRDCVFFIDSEISKESLKSSMEFLCKDNLARMNLSQKSRKFVSEYHGFNAVSSSWKSIFEQDASKHKQNIGRIIEKMHKMLSVKLYSSEISSTILRNFEPSRPKRIYVDISSTYRSGRNTGIERVVSNFFWHLQVVHEPVFQVVPLYLNFDGFWRYSVARDWEKFSLSSHGVHLINENDVVFKEHDVLYILDISDAISAAEEQGVFNKLHLLGVRINSFVYDILPLTNPSFFPNSTKQIFQSWFKTILRISHHIITFSNVSMEMIRKESDNNFSYRREINVHVERLPSTLTCVHSDLDFKNTKLQMKPNDVKGKCTLKFLMVGTIEPRKGHLEIFKIFEKLWKEGCDCELLVAGQIGWKDVLKAEKLQIIETQKKISELSKEVPNFKYFGQVSNEELCDLYTSSNFLIAASFAEGFGLPLVESQHHELVTIVRDIPIFQEVAAQSSIFVDFSDLDLSINVFKNLMTEDQFRQSKNQPLESWLDFTLRVTKIVDFNL
jgi:glycosyltransferase involved in cell wall biosynthesis